MKQVDLGEPTSFLDPRLHGVHSMGVRNKHRYFVDNYSIMFESRISAGATENLASSGKPDASISTWSCDMESYAKKCVERYLRAGQ